MMTNTRKAVKRTTFLLYRGDGAAETLEIGESSWKLEEWTMMDDDGR